jgi:hypothetical protein
MDTLILKSKRGTSSGGHDAYILGGGSSGRGARLRRCAGRHTGTIAREWGCGGWRQHYLQYVEQAEQFVKLRSRGASRSDIDNFTCHGIHGQHPVFQLDVGFPRRSR